MIIYEIPPSKSDRILLEIVLDWLFLTTKNIFWGSVCKIRRFGLKYLMRNRISKYLVGGIGGGGGGTCWLNGHCGLGNYLILDNVDLSSPLSLTQ